MHMHPSESTEQPTHGQEKDAQHLSTHSRFSLSRHGPQLVGRIMPDSHVQITKPTLSAFTIAAGHHHAIPPSPTNSVSQPVPLDDPLLSPSEPS